MISLPLGDATECSAATGDRHSAARANRASGIPMGLVPTDPAIAVRLRAALGEHYRLVWRTLRRLGVASAAADDAAQQVFLTLAARLSDVEAGMERAFLIGVCPGVAANARRRQSRLREVSEGTELDPADVDGLTPEQLLEWKQRRRILDQALDALTLEQRAVFVLFELEGFSLPEIAESLGVPLGTATSRLRRARDAFVGWVNGQQTPGGEL